MATPIGHAPGGGMEVAGSAGSSHPGGSEGAARPIRLLMACDRLGYDNERLHGAGRLMIQWTRALLEHGIEVTTVILRNPGPLGRQVLREGLPFVFLSRHPYDPRTLFDFVRLIREREIEVLHLQAFGASTFGRLAALWTGVPAIVHVHADYRGEPKGYPPHVRLVDGLLSRTTGKVLAISEAVAAFAVEVQGFQAGRVEVIHNTVDLTEFRPAEAEERESARRKLGLQKGDLAAGCVARFHEIKGVDILVEAWPIVNRSLPKAHLLLIGDGPDRASLERRVSELGLDDRVHFLGYQENVPATLWACDLAVVPSRMEGLSLAALEAMATGLPVVASRVGGIPEIVRDGRNGFLAQPCDPEHLGATVCRAFAETAANPTVYREAAIAVAREHGPSMFAEKLDAICRALARPYRVAGDGAPRRSCWERAG